MNSKIKRLTRGAIIAALYTVLCYILRPISYGNIQFRVSEALTILPLFFPEAIVGLTVGCFLANLFGNGILDLVLGPLATLLAALLTYGIGKLIRKDWIKVSLAIIPPVLINAIVVPFTFLALSEMKELYFISMIEVFLGQLGVLVILGISLYFTMFKLKDRVPFFNS